MTMSWCYHALETYTDHAIEGCCFRRSSYSTGLREFCDHYLCYQLRCTWGKWKIIFSNIVMVNTTGISRDNTDGLVQDCSNSSALAMELLQSCAKTSFNDTMYHTITKTLYLSISPGIPLKAGSPSLATSSSSSSCITSRPGIKASRWHVITVGRVIITHAGMQRDILLGNRWGNRMAVAVAGGPTYYEMLDQRILKCWTNIYWNTIPTQCGKLNFWSTHPKTDVPYKFYTKFHSPKPIFYSTQFKIH